MQSEDSQNKRPRKMFPDIVPGNAKLTEIVAWANANPHVWEIVSSTKSKAFGLNSGVYATWTQGNTEYIAVVERVRHFHALVMALVPGLDPDHLTLWRARFTFEHYLEEGFTGGEFRQHDWVYLRLSLMLDYTPDTLEEVIDRFVQWCGFKTRTSHISLDGKTVRLCKGGAMNDSSDYADVQRFLCSPEGQASLEKFRNSLLDKKIRDVEFTNNTSGVGIVLHLDHGKKLDLQADINSYDWYHLQEHYAQVLERE